MTLPEGSTPSAPVKRGIFEDVVDTFMRPSALFERYREGNFVRPALIQTVFMLVIAVAALSLITPFYEAEMQRAALQAGQPMPEGAGAMMSSIAKITTVGGMVVAPWLIVLFGGLTTLIASRIVGAKLSFKQSASVASWSFMPPAILGTLVIAILGAVVDPLTVRGITDGQLGLGRFVDPATVSPVLLALFQRLDLFSIWAMFITAVGVSVTARKDLGTGILASIIRFAIAMLFTLVPILLRG